AISQAQTPDQVEQIKEKAINDRDTKKAKKTPKRRIPTNYDLEDEETELY
ncbi:45317_t:CDS:2, partial [Gigaspora margarita]